MEVAAIEEVVTTETEHRTTVSGMFDKFKRVQTKKVIQKK
jgi:hypothetical protein